MIAVGVGHENVRDGLAVHGVEQRGNVRVIERARINDRDLPDGRRCRRRSP